MDNESETKKKNKLNYNHARANEILEMIKILQ